MHIRKIIIDVYFTLALKREFEMKRKAHYNEYYAVKLARKLLEEEEEDDDEDEDVRDTEDRPSCSRNANSSK